jgi:hypothetical protein
MAFAIENPSVVKKLGIEFSYFSYESQSFLPARDPGDLEKAFRAVVQERCDALVVFPDSAMYEISNRIAQFALEAKLPSVSGWAPFAQSNFCRSSRPAARGRRLFILPPKTSRNVCDS